MNEIVVSNNTIIPTATVNDFLRAYQMKKELIEGILREGVDFGAVPGTDKPTLKKPGAEKMSNFYGLNPTFEDVETVEDWTGNQHDGEPFFYYRQKCNLWKVVDGQKVLIASADGSCNSWEKKYRYREMQRSCPQCGKNTIIKGKAEYGGGWLCFKKKGGCGATFADNAVEITTQEVGQIKNPDIADQTNTILKMSQKRAFVAATLIATNTSDYFTQDMEDFITGEIVTDQPTQKAKVEDISQETGEKSDPVELIDPMGSWAVEYAAKYWNIEKTAAAKSIAAKKLGSKIDKREFMQIVEGA